MIFQEQIARKPDNYPWAQEYIKAMWNGHWTPEEFNFINDYHQFKTVLTDEERVIMTNTLSAIAQIEIAVKKFWSRLGDNLPHPSLTDMGIVMAAIEVIHNKAYEKLLDTLQLQDSFEQNLKIDIVNGRVTYLRKYLNKVYTNDKKQYVYALILFTLFVENVSLFSQFYIILWFNRHKNVLKDTAQQVQYTKNEELIHAQIGTKVINSIREEYPEIFDDELETRIRHEAEEAFKAESNIIDWMLGEYCEPNLSAPVLKEYVKNRINESLHGIGFEPLFELDSELIAQTEWMIEDTELNAMTDFFHKRPTEYAKKFATFNAEDIRSKVLSRLEVSE